MSGVVVVVIAVVATATLSGADHVGTVGEEIAAASEDELPHAVIAAAMTAAAVHPASWPIGVRCMGEVAMLIRVIRVADGVLTVD